MLKIIRLGENRGDIKTFAPNENIVIEKINNYVWSEKSNGK